EAGWQRTLAAADDLYTQVAEKWLRYQPHLEPVQDEFLQKALEIYQVAVQRKGTDPAVRRETGKAYRRLGDIRHRLGRSEEAQASYGESITLLEKLAAEQPDAAGHREELALSYNNPGNLRRTTGQLQEAG